MRDFSPSVVNGLFFERLSFGLVPMSIMGVRIVPQTYSGSNVAIGAAECACAQCTEVSIRASLADCALSLASYVQQVIFGLLSCPSCTDLHIIL